MRRLDRGPVDLAFSFFGNCATNDVLRLLVACDLPGHEFDDLVGSGCRAGALRAHRLDRLAHWGPGR